MEVPLLFCSNIILRQYYSFKLRKFTSLLLLSQI